MDPGLKADDLCHLRSFPAVQRVVVIGVMSRRPTKVKMLEGANDFGKTVRKLRRDGFALIDLKREPTAFSTVWYRKPPMGAVPVAHVTMLAWAARDRGGATTLMNWTMPLRRP